jgi:diguanylate cyclase (GGDEF)-like protein
MLLTRDDNTINTLQDFKNKRVMITPDAKGTASIVAMLNARKIALDDMQIQKHSFNLDDLINGKTDAMASYMSNEPLMLDNKNIKYKIFNPNDYGFDFYSDILFTSSKYIEENPELTKAFYHATEKGWKYAFEHVGTTAKLIYAKYNSQNKTLINLIAEGEILKKLARPSSKIIVGSLDKKKLQRIVDVYKVIGLISEDVNLDEFVYEHNCYKILSFDLTFNEILLYILLGILSFALITGTLFFLTIKRKWLLTNAQLVKEILIKTKNINRQTYVDFLTKAKNRKAYSEKIEEHLSLYKRYKTPFSLLLLDIDDFKRINDTYGHIVGDTVLINLVKIVKSTIRKNDFLFRVGGEEFMVILSNTSLDEAKNVSEHIRKNIEESLSTIKNETITISIGLCEVVNKDDERTIYARVDNLMYASKRSGKNKISYKN